MNIGTVVLKKGKYEVFRVKELNGPKRKQMLFISNVSSIYGVQQLLVLKEGN